VGDATAGRQALLVMDMQPAVLAHVADAEVLLSRTRVAIAAARAAGLPVLHVVVRFRPGLPEISARNLAFSRVAAGVDHLVLSGVSTSGVALSTLRLAADLDDRLTVLSDCCVDRDEEVHRVLMERVFPS
jgi:nicotinamidase-related amidase